MEDRIIYKTLSPADVRADMLDDFDRSRSVRRVWRMMDCELRLVDDPFDEDWSAEKKRQVAGEEFAYCAREGCVIYAMRDESVVGFAALPGGIKGDEGEYMVLEKLHVSRTLRGLGIGRTLFMLASRFAALHGARKLYISAHPAEETIAFYRAMGCVDATRLLPDMVAIEPSDIQLECVVDR